MWHRAHAKCSAEPTLATACHRNASPDVGKRGGAIRNCEVAWSSAAHGLTECNSQGTGALQWESDGQRGGHCWQHHEGCTSSHSTPRRLHSRAPRAVLSICKRTACRIRISCAPPCAPASRRAPPLHAACVVHPHQGQTRGNRPLCINAALTQTPKRHVTAGIACFLPRGVGGRLPSPVRFAPRSAVE